MKGWKFGTLKAGWRPLQPAVFRPVKPRVPTSTMPHRPVSTLHITHVPYLFHDNSFRRDCVFSDEGSRRALYSAAYRYQTSDCSNTDSNEGPSPTLWEKIHAIRRLYGKVLRDVYERSLQLLQLFVMRRDVPSVPQLLATRISPSIVSVVQVLVSRDSVGNSAARFAFNWHALDPAGVACLRAEGLE